jgi:general secretion pathway protein E
VTATAASDIQAKLNRLDASQVTYATQFVEALLVAAQVSPVSDVHLQPIPGGLDVRWRIDGVLQPVGQFGRGEPTDVVARLKVLAQLLTYRNDVPQEGRLRAPVGQSANVEMRVSTFPTLYGERAVVRLFANERRYLRVADLGLPAELEADLFSGLNQTSGALLITGPAGSGKTTTAYACLREIAHRTEGQRCLVSIEDPIEVAVPGVAQSQLQPTAGFDWQVSLRSILRQDPEVILVGEIRDRETVEAAFQASLTGHLVLSTFHAGDAAEGLSRLADMGIEPYLLRSGLRALVNQRLVRRLCACASDGEDESTRLGLSVTRWSIAHGCERCRQIGYQGRMVLAEWLPPLEGELGAAVLARRDSRELYRIAQSAGMVPLAERAIAAVEAGFTDPAEVRRVLGISQETVPPKR